MIYLEVLGGIGVCCGVVVGEKEAISGRGFALKLLFALGCIFEGLRWLLGGTMRLRLGVVSEIYFFAVVR